MELPISFGSKILPTKTWITPTIDRTNNAGPNSPNCNRQNTAGKSVPANDPTVGIKLKMKMI